MYDPEVVDRRLHNVRRTLGFKLKRYSIADSIDRQDHLAALWDFKLKKPTRAFTGAEQEFCANEIILSTYDFNYWAPRYAFLNSPTGEMLRLNFWESQAIAMQHIARGELRAWREGGDNLWDWLKARQLGATQVSASLISHRLFFHENQRAIIASDEQDHSLELSRRVEKIYEKLPYWMKPRRKFHVKGTEMYFDILNCSLVIGHGRKEGGGLGQGQTTNIFHFTELPDWENFNMIEEDFMPTVPIHPTSVGLMESTARGRHDQWHDHFKLAWEGKSRFKAFFIPYYAEPTRYRLRPPEGWQPHTETKLHADQVERDSPKYCQGKTVRLSPEQMYFWEFTRAEYTAKGKLWQFLQEYASNHLEAFQNASMGMFDENLMFEMRNKMRPFVAYDVVPQKARARDIPVGGGAALLQ